MAISLKRDSVLGLVFFGGLVLLLYATVALGAVSLGEKKMIQVAFPNARGVKAGDNVFVLGTRIGIVDTIDYQQSNADYPISMRIQLDRDIDFRADYEIRIADSSLLGGKQVSMNPGRAPELNKEPLLGTAPPNAIEALGDIIGGEGNKRNLQQILENFNAVTRDLRDGKGTIGEAVSKVRDFFTKAEDVAESIRLAVDEARRGEGKIGKVVTEAGDFLEKADDIAATIQTGDGVFRRLLKDKQMADNIDASIANITRVTDDLAKGRGIAGKLINDPDWTAKATEILDELGKASKALNEGDGLLAAALHDKELRDDVKSTAGDIRDIVADLRAGKGTIGRLLNDDTLMNDFEKLINQIRRTVEDAREAAPVSTFVSIFTGAFQ